MIETQLLDNGISVIYPNWDAPKNVKCFITTRIGGVSKDKYQGLNLGSHVNDDPNLVLKNRSLLLEHLPSEPKWLNQVHGNDVVQIKDFNATLPDCDGAVTVLKKHTLCVLSADCLPIFFSNFSGDIVGVCHAGWKGLLSGVIENTLKSISNIVSPDSNSRYFSTLNVYLGPSISMPHFEVGAELKDAFLSHSRDKLTIDSFESSANPKKYSKKTNEQPQCKWGCRTERIRPYFITATLFAVGINLWCLEPWSTLWLTFFTCLTVVGLVF